jgi:lipopolysaccharide transport system permease protein
MKAVVRTSESPLVRPGEFLRNVLQDLGRSRSLAIEIARRDIRNQYRRSLLGIGSLALPPVAMACMALGFRQAGVLHPESAGGPYELYVLLGVILWTTFVEAIYAPIVGLVADRRLLTQSNAPAEAIALGKLGTVFFNAAVRLGIFAIACTCYRCALPTTALLAPFGLLGLVVLGTAVGLALTPINFLYHDVSKILGTVTTFWLFISPVYFPPPSSGSIGVVMRLNPVTPLLSSTRDLALTGMAPDASGAAWVVAVASLSVVSAWLCVRVVLPALLGQAND